MRPRLIAIAGFAALLVVQPAVAVDGTIEINHARALAGGITPGDTAGYPVTISQPGSYRLTSNLTVPGGVSGVEVTASDVSLDLNGFAILGPRTCTGTPVTSCAGGTSGSGVSAAAAYRNIRIANGTIAGMHMGVLISSSGRIERVATHDNYGGIALGTGEIVHSSVDQNEATGIGGDQIQVSSSRVSGNGSYGIWVEHSARLFDNVVISNGSDGISTYGSWDSGRAVISRNVVAGSGMRGIWSAVAEISDNTVTENGSDGIYVSAAGVVRDNVVRGNTGYGVRVPVTGARVSGNYLSVNTAGSITGAAHPTGANTCGSSACP